MSSVLPLTPGLQTTFDDNNDDLLHLLSENWDSPLKTTITDSKWTREYLTKLTTLPLNELLHEPIALKQEQAKAKRDAQQLAFRDYPSFLHAQTCRKEATETLDGLDDHLAEFVSSVPELQQVCEEFVKQGSILKEERGKITSVLEHQNVLTDLLEIPQLMETCVWNGYYSEAMDLASHVRLLQVRYPLSVIKSIQQQVQASSDLMLVQLVSHLRKPIRLAAAMNVVGFLRRMDVFDSETELRMVFLRCRHDFLQQRLARTKRDISEDNRQRTNDAFEYLKRYIDVMREQMFEIGTQYISIFSNEQGGTLLSDYMVQIIGYIKAALDTYLVMIEDTSALASLLTQLQYCGMSLGRIGLDFRHIFVHAFEDAMQPMILKWIDASTEDLVKLIISSIEQVAAPSTWMSSKIVSQSTYSSNERPNNAFQPPMLLVGYPSLAIFTNSILSVFNAVRLLPAVSLYLPIQNHLEACFLEIGHALKQYSDQASSQVPDEMTYLQSYSAAYVRCCVPYLKSCFVDGIYGNLSVPPNADETLEHLLLDYLPLIVKEETEDVQKQGENVDLNQEKELQDVVDEQRVEDSVNTNEGETVSDLYQEEFAITDPVDDLPAENGKGDHQLEAKDDSVEEELQEAAAMDEAIVENTVREDEAEEEAIEAEATEEQTTEDANIDEPTNKVESVDEQLNEKEPMKEEAIVEEPVKESTISDIPNMEKDKKKDSSLEEVSEATNMPANEPITECHDIAEEQDTENTEDAAVEKVDSKEESMITENIDETSIKAEVEAPAETTPQNTRVDNNESKPTAEEGELDEKEEVKAAASTEKKQHKKSKKQKGKKGRR